MSVMIEGIVVISFMSFIMFAFCYYIKKNK